MPGRSAGIEAIAEPAHPAFEMRTLAELLRGARRSPLVTMDVPTPGVTGKGEFVHPDLVVAGGRAWLLFTGYPLESSAERTYDNRAENPSLVTSTDWQAWAPPGGLQNPLFAPPSRGYNSDGSLLLDPGRRLHIAFNRRVGSRDDGSEHNIIEYRRSRDGGVTWGPTRETLVVPAHRAISPDLLMERSNYGMWVVNAGAAGCRAKATTIERYLGTPFGAELDSIRWGRPQRVEWTQPGWTHWHIDVSRMGEYYFGLSAAYPEGTNCTRIELFAALSADGIHWQTLGEPIERLGDVRSTTASLYRATAAYDERTGLLDIAFSAASGPTFAWENFRRTYDGPSLVGLFRDFGTGGGPPVLAAVATPTSRSMPTEAAYAAFVRNTLARPH